MTAFVAYLRVSTQKQGESGLGLDAQREAVRRFLGTGDVLLATFTEVESGKNCNRPQLKLGRLIRGMRGTPPSSDAATFRFGGSLCSRRYICRGYAGSSTT
jgi:hypothetical protein